MNRLPTSTRRRSDIDPDRVVRRLVATVFVVTCSLLLVALVYLAA